MFVRCVEVVLMMTYDFLVSHPKEFACSVLPRSTKAAELIRSIEDEHPFEPSDAAALLRA